MSKIICIDAGHGGKDAGAVSGARYEKNDNLRFALALGALLENQGFKVYQTRTTDTWISLQDRSDYANKMNADYFISIHRNSFVNETANGVENWVYERTDNHTIEYATAIQNELVKVGVQSNRGVKKGNFHVTRETHMPACLLELCFIKNKRDNELYDLNFDEYVTAVTVGICKSTGVEYRGNIVENNPPSTPDSECYRVRIQTFESEDSVATGNALGEFLKLNNAYNGGMKEYETGKHRIDVFSYIGESGKEKAEKLVQALKLLGIYSVVQRMDD